MRPTTEAIPKVLIPVAGRPFAEVQLEWVAAQGVEQVVYSVGYRSAMVRDVLGDGRRFGLTLVYVDEGDDLRGTGGALRLAADQGVLPDAFFLLYGDSYLSVDLVDVERAWHASALPALMTVLHNDGRWDRSNAILDAGRVLYDKRFTEKHDARIQWIDYGLSVLSAEAVCAWLPPGGRGDVADLFHDLGAAGRLAGYEVHRRFYEIGSPEGLRDLEAYLRKA